MTQLFTGYVGAMLAQHAQDPAGHWRSKDCAIYLVTALTLRGGTAARGATVTNQLVNINDFLAQQVLPELQGADVNALPILKADALKFLTLFRWGALTPGVPWQPLAYWMMVDVNAVGLEEGISIVSTNTARSVELV